jgi:hypothetical protein
MEIYFVPFYFGERLYIHILCNVLLLCRELVTLTASDDNTEIQLVANKNGNCQNKIGTFLQFFHSVKPSYERIG